MDLFTLVAKIGLDSQEYEQGIRKSKSSILELGGFINAKTIAMGQMIARGAEKAFNTVASLSRRAIQTAADQEALDSLASATFGELESAANGVFDSIGKDTNMLSQQLKSVGTSAFMQFKGAGVDAAEAMTMMDKYIRLAADGAAAYNMSVDEADTRLRSFLRGNTEAGDAIGLQVSESTRASKAMEVYGKKWQALTEAQKQMLMLNIVDAIYDQTNVIGQAAREGHEWENVINKLDAAQDTLLKHIGKPFKDALTPFIEKVTDLFSDETIGTRVEMLSTAFADIGSVFLDDAIDLIDKILEWSNENKPLTFDLHIPTWTEIQTTAETALATIQSGIKSFATWTLGAFTLDGVSIPEILQTAKTWWSGQGANAYERLKSVFTWTLGSFVAPSVDGFFDGIPTWWEETAQPALTAITQWSFGELIVPAWGDFALSIKDWWINDFLPSMTAILTWNLGDLKLPSIEDVQEKISTWWNTVKAGLKLSFSASYSRTFSQAELEQGQKDYKDEIDAISSPSIVRTSKRNAPSFATGLDYVPYDNFIAKLHAGETVLNRANATAYRAGIVGGIDYARLGQITAEAVSNALAGMTVTMSGEQVGRLTAKTVSREIAKGTRSLRYANI
nr:MAG TPA: minor tail protein [Caudoviricetes sp.]